MDTVRLVDLVDAESTIRDKEVTDTLVVGPGVVTLLQNAKFEDCSFQGEADALFIEVAEDKRSIGIVGLANVTFTRCRFYNVGIIGTTGVISQLRGQLGKEPALHLSGATGPAGP